MSNDKQLTSIDWLEREIQKSLIPAQKDYFKWAFEQAKAKHEEEIIKFAEDWEKSNLDCKEDLYNETFNSDEA